jgi:hypothetical protein
MAITTVDGAIAGARAPTYYAKSVSPTLVAGRPTSSWYLAGAPGAGAADTTTSGGITYSNTSSLVAGSPPWTDPVSGNTYLMRFTGAATQPGTLLLCDRLWQTGYNITGSAALSVTATTAQTVTSAAFPARDIVGSANGQGVYLAVEVSSTLGNGSPTWTLSYTNSTATGGTRTATNIDPVTNTAAQGSFFRIGLQAGDVGVKQVNTFQASATSTSGQFVLVAYRVLASLEIPVGGVSNALDAFTAGFPQLYNGTCPFFVFIPSTTTASTVTGTVVYTQG